MRGGSKAGGRANAHSPLPSRAFPAGSGLMRASIWLVLVAILSGSFFAGCAMRQAGSGGPPPYLNSLKRMGVSQTTYSRIVNQRVLTFSDVLDLVKRGVPGNMIVAYMQSTRAPYNFTRAQVNQLVAAGADSTLVNYVGRAAGDFLIDAQNAAQQQRVVQDARESKFWSHAYFTDPFFGGPPPFDFGWPALWY
jgi:hypothetical protein